MANETILVVDADTKSQKVLEVSFKKAGYRVLITDSVERARGLIEAQRPDLIVSDTELPEGDGFAFCEQLSEHPEWGAIPFVFLTEQRALPQKMRGFELGADEYLTKPIYIKEVTSRVEVLLQKKAQEALSGGEAEQFEGKLADVTMIDLLQTIERQLRSGSLQINRDGRKGAVYFREGNILDAMCGKLQGEEALYRLMLWPDGDFRVEYHDNVRRADHIEKDSGELLLEGIHRLDKWNQLVDTLPPLGRVYEADYQRLPELLREMPEEAGRVVRLFDGVRSLRGVIDDSPFNDIITLQIVRRLLDEDVLLEMATDETSGSPAKSNLEAWLAGSGHDDSMPTPFSQVDSSVEVTAPLDANNVGDERSGPGDTHESPPGGVARDAEEPEQLEQVEQPEDEESGQWKVHWNGGESRDDDGLKELEEREVRRREEEAKHLLRQSGRFEAVDRDTEPVDAVSSEVPAETRDEADDRDEGAGEGFWRGRRATPVTTPVGKVDRTHQRAAADSTSPGIQVARLDAADEGGDEAAAPAADESAEQLDSPSEPRVDDDEGAADAEESDELRSSAERRAASVEEAASVQREATRSVRESAPYPAVERSEGDDTEPIDDEQDEPAADAEPQRVTEEISAVEEDEVAAGDVDADAPDDEPVSAEAEQAADETDAPEVDVEEADEAKEADESDLGAVAVEGPAVERIATDREIVKAEYDLSASGADAAGGSVETADKEVQEAKEPRDEQAEAPAEEPEEAEEPAEEAEEAEEAVEAEEPEDPKEAAEPEEAEEAEEAEEPEEADAGSMADDFFSEPLVDESHEESFFSDGEEGDYDWEFEDVPKTSGRWGYFAAVAILSSLFVVVLVIFGSDEPAPENANTQPDEEVAAVEDTEEAEQDDEELAEAEDDQPEAPTGRDAGAAELFAWESADEVTYGARATALVMTGVDPYTARQRAMEEPGDDAAGDEPLEGDAQPGAEGASEQPAAQQGQASAQQANQPPKQEKDTPKENERAASGGGNSFDDRVATASALVRKGRNSKALKVLRQLSKEKPGHAKTAYLHGQAAIETGNNDEAIKHLSRADKLGYRKAGMYLDLATAHQLTGDIGGAKTAYKKFLDMQPTGKRADEVRSILERL